MSAAVARTMASQDHAGHNDSVSSRPLPSLALSKNKELPPLPQEHVGPQPPHGYVEGYSRHGFDVPPVPPPKPSQISARNKSHRAATVQPQVGFQNLAPTFHMWSRVKPITGSATIELGNQPLAHPSYTAKLGTSGGRTTVRDTNFGQVVADGTEKNPMRSKCTLSVNGFDSELQRSGTSHYFSAPVRGTIDTFEWRKGRMGRDWTLVSSGSPLEAPPLATWHCKSDYVKRNTELGVFEFHGPALSGEMGETFLALAIMALVRIYHKSYESKVAAGSSPAAEHAASVPVAVA
uniref:Uncharacterized protein n=1 Tax=Bionectria ochroleuca TaxID=29856 RepID=A0A8H7N462_BIOOC